MTVDRSILRFSLLVDYEAAYFIYKIKHGLVRCHNSIQTNYEVTGRVTRGSNQLHRGDFLTTAGQKSIFYRGILEFNKIPDAIRSDFNLNSFKTNLKNHIRNNWVVSPYSLTNQFKLISLSRYRLVALSRVPPTC